MMASSHFSAPPVVSAKPSNDTLVADPPRNNMEAPGLESTTTRGSICDDLSQPFPSAGTLQERKSRERAAETDIDSSEAGDITEKDIEREAQTPSSRRPSNQEPAKDPHLITWNGPDDPENPQNWPESKKWMVTIALSTMTFCITFASSVFSTATMVTAKQFQVGTEVTTLGTSLFVLGFTFGPLLWGPLSEASGRMMPLFFGFAIFAIFQIPVAVAQNLETIMICRFLGGLFGCAPLAIVGGALADFWNPVDRGVAVAIFASATFIGPVAVS